MSLTENLTQPLLLIDFLRASKLSAQRVSRVYVCGMPDLLSHKRLAIVARIADTGRSTYPAPETVGRELGSLAADKSVAAAAGAS